jgi:transposase
MGSLRAYVWLATQPLDMRSGFDSCLARVIKVFGAAHPHTAYLFANQRANRMKVLVHDGIGLPWSRIGEGGIISVV